MRKLDYLAAVKRTEKSPIIKKRGATAYFRKSDNEILAVGYPCDPPHANRYIIHGIDESFESQMVAETWLEELAAEQEKKSNA
jgi:hypothetical protein